MLLINGPLLAENKRAVSRLLAYPIIMGIRSFQPLKLVVPLLPNTWLAEVGRDKRFNASVKYVCASIQLLNTRLTENIFGSGSLHDVLITFSRYKCSRGQENDVFLASFFARFLWKKKEVTREEFHYYSFISQVRLYSFNRSQTYSFE